MPPKKGKKGGKKGKKKKDKAEEGPEESLIDKETILQQELESLTQELEDLKKQVEELRSENEWLQQEAQKVRTESHEYMSYMDKKTSKRQTTIISLSDQNQKEIRDIQEQKRLMLEEFAKKKAFLRNILMEKENIMAKTKQELEDLSEYKSLQQEQLNKIKELEREVMTMRGKHSDAIQSLKSRFLKEKHDFQQDSEEKVASMSKQANKEAIQCLNSHTSQIKEENRKLRQELLLLIRKTRALHEHRRELERQKVELLVEEQYATDLRTLRNARQHKVLKSFGVTQEELEDNSWSASKVSSN